MELGTGVFLSAVFLGTVGLFIATKDRWNWKKIFLWPLAVVAGLSLVGGLVAYAYKQYEERPKVLTEFNGIRLGEQFQDVAFRHGKPERQSSWAIAGIGKLFAEGKVEKGTARYAELEALLESWKKTEAEELAKGKTDADYVFGKNIVEIESEKVNNILYFCETDSTDFSEANGIGCGREGDEILRKFGSAVRVLCEKEPDKVVAGNVRRVYDVVKYGTRYHLTKNIVKGILIASPNTLESYVGKNWVKCS